MSERPAREPDATPPAPPPRPGPAATNAAAITHSTACHGCGFDLLGISAAGRCPECGMPAARSLGSKLLVNASPDYVRSLHQGTAWLVVACVLQALYSIAVLAVEVAYNVWPPTPGAPATDISTRIESLRTLAYLAGVPTTAILLWGLWLFTQPDPGESLKAQPRTARSVLRIVTIIQFPLTLGSIATVLGVPDTATGKAIEAACSLIYLATLVAQYIALCRYAKWLARRIPDDALARRADVYAWLLPVLSTAGCVVLLLGPFVALVLLLLFYNTFRKRLRDILLTMSSNPVPLPPNNSA